MSNTNFKKIIFQTIALLAGLLTVGAQALSAATLTASHDAHLTLENPQLVFKPQYFTKNWNQGGSFIKYETLRDKGPLRFFLKPDNKHLIEGCATFTRSDNAVKADYKFTARDEVVLNSLLISATLSLEQFAGGSWRCNGKSAKFPKEYKDMQLMRENCSEISLKAADGGGARIMFPAETQVMIQDNRKWTESYSLRIGYPHNFTFSKGDSRSIKFALMLPEGFSFKHEKPITLTAGSEWTPLSVELDIEEGSALDFSQLGFNSGAAGKHGRVITKGPHFVFEKMPDKPQRFYGVNFCFSANYLARETAEMVARRLARVGYNSIRIHHHENIMVSGSDDATALNQEQMRKFDNFTAACIKEGLYISTDLYVSRSVPWRAIGIDKPGNIPMKTFKSLVPVHQGAYDNLKRYVTNWLTHVNPHTGRSYADEPALAWINILNEANFGNNYGELKEIPEWRQAWRRWLKEKKSSEPDKYASIPKTIPDHVDMNQRNPHQAAFLLFFRDLEITMINKFRKLLRDELGCEALLTNANGWSHYLPDHFARSQTYDYIDDHFYVDHPRFLERGWRLPSRCPNTNPIKNSHFGGRREIYMRHYDKPFTITEYNYSGPGRFRGVGGILTGSLAALQDWSGLWRFAYSHSGQALAIGQAPAMGYFDMLNDPLSLAAERASICLFLREDIAPLPKSVVIHLPQEEFETPENRFYRSHHLWGALGWSRKVGIQVGGAKPQGYTHTVSYPEVFEQYNQNPNVIPFINSDVETLMKENQALAIDKESGSFIINTARTCGGFAEEGIIKAGFLSAELSESAATIWVSSVDDQPLVASERMILTHLTDIQNTGIEYAEDQRRTLLKWGKLPHLVRVGSARISLDLDSPEKYRVFALTTGGRRRAPLSSSVSKGTLCFTAKTAGFDNNAVIIYEIVRE